MKPVFKYIKQICNATSKVSEPTIISHVGSRSSACCVSSATPLHVEEIKPQVSDLIVASADCEFVKKKKKWRNTEKKKEKERK